MFKHHHHQGDSHAHGHDHKHEHDDNVQRGALHKELALLRYMYEHNKQHAQELTPLGGSIHDAGFENAAALIKDAGKLIISAADKLSEAAALLESD